MDREKSNRTVLARIPDLSADTGGRISENEGGALPMSCGRWTNQTLAFKLLSGLTLLLIVVAVLPFFSSRKEKPVDASSTTDALTPWRQEPSATAPEARMAQSHSRPVTRVRAIPEQSPASGIPPGQPTAKNDANSKPATDEPLMSAWPNPARAGAEESRADADPTTSRPPEYEANARAGDEPK